MMQFNFNGVPIYRSDFTNDLKGYVAFSIAFANVVKCRDREAALELLNHEAEKIIEQVKSGKAP